MGSWSVSCGISNIAITSGNECVLLPIKENKTKENGKWSPATLPIFGQYNDYGGIEHIVIDDNTKLIEDHFGISIDEFCTFLVDGKFTYDREEAKAILDKISDNIDDIVSWRFMWIDKKVYDFMTKDHNDYYKGQLDYGTKEFLNLFGFEFVEKSDSFENYDPKRFNQLWKKGNVNMFSDGRILLSGKNNYVYNFGKGDETSIETYFEVPKELEYLKELSSHDAWRILGKEASKVLSSVFGKSYDFEYDTFSETMRKKFGDSTIDSIMSEINKAPKVINKKYSSDLEKYGDRLAAMINLEANLYPMSGALSPHSLYLTPQCGDYEAHQKILEKFCEINKSYINVEDDY